VAETPVISIVDDDPAVRDALCCLMESVGFQAEVFASAQDFLDSSRVADTTCLILDVRMPGMTGLQLQRQLIASHQNVPIVLISGHADDKLRARALEAGAADFFEKPFRNEALLKAVDRAIARRSRRTPDGCGD
jgi:FixJ family two-component response regulator